MNPAGRYITISVISDCRIRKLSSGTSFFARRSVISLSITKTVPFEVVKLHRNELRNSAIVILFLISATFLELSNKGEIEAVEGFLRYHEV